MRLLSNALFVSSAICLAMPAHASSTDWFRAEGGAVRLVTTGLPDASGKLSGALQIELEPGWKTYWRDPGGSGVPPSVDIGSAGTVEMMFPAPQWHNDGVSNWAGYTQSVSLPVTLTLAQPAAPFSANVFLGVCKTICVPLQATVSLDPSSDPDSGDDAAAVKSAVTALPQDATPELQVTKTSFADSELTGEVALPPGEAAELFVAGTDGYMFGKPRLDQQAGKPTFSVKVLARPESAPTGLGLPYTLVTPKGAVSGFIPYF